MNFELFITKRLVVGKNRSFSRLIIRMAVAAVGLSLAVMIVANAIVTGFQNQVQDKVFNFWGHIHITNYDSNVSFEPTPISKKQDFYPYIDTIKGFKHIQVFATKAGIIKTDTDIEGMVLKGIDNDFDWNFLKSKIVSGSTFLVHDSVISKDILVSKTIASRLKLTTGDKIIIYFIHEGKQRPRVFYIKGIYNTGLQEYDSKSRMLTRFIGRFRYRYSTCVIVYPI